MADLPGNEVLASNLADAGRPSQENGVVAKNATSPTAIAPESTSTSFQAINSQAVSQNVNTGVSTAAPQPQDAAVTHDPSQTAQTSQATTGSKVPSQVEEPDANMATDAATYGTRSRNRTGNARPNYAEDQDMDIDYAAASKKKSAADSAAVAASNIHGTGETKRTHDFAKFMSNAVNSMSSNASRANASATKESTPGTSGGTANVSKKRKAGGAPAGAVQTPPPSNPSAAPVARKLEAPSATARESNVMTFTKSRFCLNKKGELVADDGTKLSVNDHVYLVCEPPGDPYYLCRIMEFLHARSDDPTSPIDSLRVNWYYRPRDVQRFNSDSRLVYGTMHSDLCPIASLRGKCTIKHRSEIEDLDAYRKERDSFYFVQIFDRFIHRWYECIPVSQIVNVPEKVKKALDERWKFVVVEIGRVKELTSDVKTCKRCAKYCATNDSVECAICKNSYHMNCVQPPLPKKPSRGFAWACGPCSRASEKKLEARNTPNVSGDVTEVEDEEIVEEEQPSASNDTTRAPSPSGDVAIDDHPATQAEIALAKMWPMRYLGIHCRVEDALQYDDRAIYPRASSRLGPRHQAHVTAWPGRPVELVKPADIKKRYNKSNSHKKDGKLTKETIAALEADREERARRPQWVQDEPAGYVARGEDYPPDDPRNTAKLMFHMPPEKEQSERGSNRLSSLAKEQEVDDYLKRAKGYARGIGVPPFGANFLDKALELLTDNDFNQWAALQQLQSIHRVHDLHEPVLSKQDLAKFEEGVAKYGSEHRLVRLHMKTHLPTSDIIRFYYLWKKTPKGKEIWGHFGGRKGSKRRGDDVGTQLQQSVANEGDDSAFDNDKAVRRNKAFQCKFCNVTHCRQWRKAPGVAPGQMIFNEGKNGEGKGNRLLALCLRCAGLWRKYAIQWEDIDEVAKKVAQGGGRAWKRRIDEELLRELVAANDAAAQPNLESASAAVPSIETNGEPPKKKPKMDAPASKPLPPPPKEPTPPPPPIVPAQPQWKILPCAVCKGHGDTISCAHCRLTVHRNCFGVDPNEGMRPEGGLAWICEQCANDRNPQVSTDYACCLCLTEETLIDLVEPPKISHKKKTDREREKERMEKELADAMRLDYRNKQFAMNRSPIPREPLKRTTGNNWVHVYCAVWMPEIRFSNAKILEVAEGFQNIPTPKVEAVCKLCKNKDHQNRFRDDKGACTTCFQCQANIHVSCAFEAGYTFGFDVTPVKGSRKDQVTTATLGQETGSLTAGIWCKEHVSKNVVHPINEAVDDAGKTAMQVFVENYKQADLTLTGTIRKANLAQLAKDKVQQVSQPAATGSRRESTVNSIAAAVRRGARTSTAAEARVESEDAATHPAPLPEAEQERRCAKCNIDVTPKWHAIQKEPKKFEMAPPTSPHRSMSGVNGGLVDGERDRSGAPASPQTARQNAQNIRFMPPGASGRAWDGMPDRYAPRSTPNGEPVSREQGSMMGELSAPLANGGQQLDGVETNYQHQFQPGLNQEQPLQTMNAEPAVEEGAQEYLCHKCFLKKKLNPTPSPPAERPATHSPPRLFPLTLSWSGSNQPRSPQATFDTPQPVRMPWDEPQPTQSQPPPSQPSQPANGVGTSTVYGPPPAAAQQPPRQTPSYPGYNQQPNGYHAPASAQQQPPPHPPQHQAPPPLHERTNSYGYGHGPPPPPANNQPHYPQHHQPGPSSLPTYGPPPPPGHHMANGAPSPRAPQFQQPMQSPTRHHAPPYQGFGPGRTESPYTPTQLPPFDPRASGSFIRQSEMSPHVMQHQQHSQPLSQPSQASQTSQPPSLPQYMSTQTMGSQTSPIAAHVRPLDGQVPRPDSQGSGTPSQAAVGASASPDLRNLLS